MASDYLVTPAPGPLAQRLLEERLGMRPEPADAVGVSNGLAVHITREGTR